MSGQFHYVFVNIWNLYIEIDIAIFVLKCLIQLDQRIQYQNAIARNLAHFLNSPQQGEPPSAWISNSTLPENNRLQRSTLVVWGENPVTVWTLCFLYIDVIQIVATVMESANIFARITPVFLQKCMFFYKNVCMKNWAHCTPQETGRYIISEVWRLSQRLQTWLPLTGSVSSRLSSSPSWSSMSKRPGEWLQWSKTSTWKTGADIWAETWK